MYSGYRSAGFPFAYGAFTLSGRLSQNLSARITESIMRSEPRCARTTVWPLSISLAATLEIDVSFSSSGYLDVSVHRVPSVNLWIQLTVTEVSSAGFPHSDICGSRDICSSPQLFAAYHVFLRLLVPRHPPCALISLTFLVSLDFISVWNLLLWVLSLLRFVICYYDCFSFRCLVIISDIFKINFCIRFSRYDFDWILSVIQEQILICAWITGKPAISF